MATVNTNPAPSGSSSIQETVLKSVTGPFGALTLACCMLWVIMQNYQSLVDQLITDHAADRALYRETMATLSNEMSKVSDDLQDISTEIKEIRRSTSK